MCRLVVELHGAQVHVQYMYVYTCVLGHGKCVYDALAHNERETVKEKQLVKRERISMNVELHVHVYICM